MSRACWPMSLWLALACAACGGKTRDSADGGGEGDGGDCGNGCPTGSQCVDGACVAGECDELCRSGVCCRIEYAGGVHTSCVDLLTQPFNCGACGTVCDSPWVCEAGACVCPVDICDGQCVGLHVDRRNCGECGHVCPPETPECYARNCVTCQDRGLAECGESACVDTLGDDRHCGRCGNPCAEGSQCLQGVCVAGNCGRECPSVCCDGSCVDLDSDQANCGECGNACEDVEEVCDFGSCHGAGVP